MNDAILATKHGVAWERVEQSMPNTRAQNNMHLSLTLLNLLAQMYIHVHVCAAELATWGVGPDVHVYKCNHVACQLYMLISIVLLYRKRATLH